MSYIFPYEASHPDGSHPVNIIRTSTCLQEDPAAPGWTTEYVGYTVSSGKAGNMYLNCMVNGDTDPDKRNYVTVDLADLTTEFAEGLASMVHVIGEDIDTIGGTNVLQSPSGKRYFVPCLDMKDYRPLEHSLEAITEFFRWMELPRPYVVRTDASWHLYFPIRVPMEKYGKFLGSAIMCNTHHRREAIDSSWVGMALVRERPVLRWSKKGRNARSTTPAITDIGSHTVRHELAIDLRKRETHNVVEAVFASQ